MSDCATVTALLPGLSVDALEDHERDLARAHVGACGACAARLEALARALGEVEGDEPPPPPDDVWEKIEAAIAREVVAEAGAEELPPVDADDEAPPPEKKARDAAARPRRTSLSLEGDPFAVGPYTPLEVISAGAMGVVFRARHRETGEVVALKVMHEELARSALHVRRFRQEAQALAALDHPGIVPVREVGQAGGQHYIAMGLIQGEPLDAHVARGERWDVARVLGVVAALARAVQHAHAQGVVHRDLKPANVLVDEAGRPVIADFGLAALVTDRWASGAGEVTGTPHYMAPEQVRGEPVDRRADVWSLGVILYYLLTHELPFPGDAAVEVQQRVLDDEPTPPRRLDPRIEPALEAVILRALEKVPAHRYPSAAELAQDLERVARGERVVVARPRRWRPERSRARRFLVGALSGALVASGAAAWGLGVAESRATAQLEAERAWRARRAEADRHVVDARAALAQAERTLDAARAALAAGRPAEALYEAGNARGRVDDVAAALERGAARDMAVAKLLERAGALRREAELTLARAHAALGRPRDAAEVLARALDDDPYSLPLWRELARLEAQAGALEAARASIEEALRLAPDDPESHVELGRIDLERGDAAGAAGALGRALELDPRRVDALLLRAEARRRLGELEAAARDAQRATELQPDDARAWMALGRIEHALGRLDAASAAFGAADDRDPRADALAARALVRLDQGDPEGARRDLELALRYPDATPLVRVALGVALEAAFEEEAALLAYEAAASADDARARALAHARLARLELARADEVRCRLEAEDRLRERSGGAPPALDALLLEAARLQVRRVERARAAVAAALRADGASPSAQLAAARLALADDDLAGAAEALERAASGLAAVASPTTGRHAPWPWVERPASLEHEHGCLRGELLLARGGDALAAARAFERALAADATGAWARAGLAAVDVALGREAAAEEALARAREGRGGARGAREAGWLARAAEALDRQHGRAWTRSANERAQRAWALVTARDPRDARAWLRRAELARQAARWDEAVALVQRALEVDPGLDGARLLEGELFGLDLPVERDPATGRPVHVRDVGRAEQALRRVEAARPLGPGARSRSEAQAWRDGAALLRVKVRAAARGADLPSDRDDHRRLLRDLADRLRAREGDAAGAVLIRTREAFRWLAELEPDRESHRTQLAQVEALGREWGADLVRSARAALARGDFDRALADLDGAVLLAPDLADAWWERGLLLVKIGAFVPGILDMARAAQLDPARFDGALLADWRSVCFPVDPARVLAELDDLLVPGPDEPHVRFLRAFYRLEEVRRGRGAPVDLDACVDELSAALRADPGFHVARTLRALAHLEAGRPDAALEDARAASAAGAGAAPCWVEAVAWARLAEAPGLDAAEVARRRSAAVERLEAARARGMDVDARVGDEPAFEAMRAAGLLGR